MSVQDFLTGNTIKTTWVNTGVTPTTIVTAIYTGSETVIDSGSMVSSGNGAYYYLHTVPTAPGYYVVETIATISGKPYKNRIKYRAVIMDVN